METLKDWAEQVVGGKHVRVCVSSSINGGTIYHSAARSPKVWPLRLAEAHWAAVLPGVPAEEYTPRCRSMPRKSGHPAIEAVAIKVQPAAQ